MKLPSSDVNANSNEKDSDKTKIDDSMNQNRSATSMHIPKLHNPVPTR